MSTELLDRQHLMRRVVVLIVIMTLGAGGGGGALAMSWFSRASQPALWISEESVDFGAMSPQEKTSRSLVLRNTGGRKLIIRDVQASCACTGTDLLAKELAPGAETVLKVTFTASDAPYSQAMISLTTNDPERQVRFIELRARKPWGIDVEPRTLFFTSVGVAQEVYVSTSRGDIFKNDNQVSAASATDFVTTTVVPEKKKLRAIVIVRRSDLEVTGTYSSSIRVRDKRALIDEKVRVQLAGQSQIFLPRPGVTLSWPVPDADAGPCEISVPHRTGERVEVASIEIDGEVQHVLSVDSVRNTDDETIITLHRTTNGNRDSGSDRLRGYILVNASAGGDSEIFSLPISVSVRRSRSASEESDDF